MQWPENQKDNIYNMLTGESLTSRMCSNVEGGVVERVSKRRFFYLDLADPIPTPKMVYVQFYGGIRGIFATKKICNFIYECAKERTTLGPMKGNG